MGDYLENAEDDESCEVERENLAAGCCSRKHLKIQMKKPQKQNVKKHLKIHMKNTSKAKCKQSQIANALQCHNWLSGNKDCQK